jgi:hypothetical protein
MLCQSRDSASVLAWPIFFTIAKPFAVACFPHAACYSIRGGFAIVSSPCRLTPSTEVSDIPSSHISSSDNLLCTRLPESADISALRRPAAGGGNWQVLPQTTVRTNITPSSPSLFREPISASLAVRGWPGRLL